MSVPLHRDRPRIIGPLPGPRAERWLKRDAAVMSPSYTRTYPLVVRRASMAMGEDFDGNRFLDFTAGIAVTNAGHSHPRVVRAIRRQAGRLIHMSGTDFYYTPQVKLAERLARLAPGECPKRVFYTNSGAEAIEAAGVDAPYLCRGGVCGQCVTDVLELEGTLIHHDHWLSDEEKASGKKLMPCVSRARCTRLVLDR